MRMRVREKEKNDFETKQAQTLKISTRQKILLEKRFLRLEKNRNLDSKSKRNRKYNFGKTKDQKYKQKNNFETKENQKKI